MKQTAHPPRRRSWLSQQIHRRPLPVWIVALLHLLALGVADRVFDEPAPGQPFDPLYDRLRRALSEQLEADCALPEQELLQARYEKFRRIGRIEP